MRIMSWNYRGLRTADNPTIPFLRWLVCSLSPTFPFLMETKLCIDDVVSLAALLCFTNCVVVDAIGLSGGLILFW